MAFFVDMISSARPRSHCIEVADRGISLPDASQDLLGLEVLSPYTAQAVSRALNIVSREGLSEGSYFEFGVYQGLSLIAAYRTAEDLQFENFEFFGFDSFSGLPAPSHPDFDSFLPAGKYACSRKDLARNLSRAKVNQANIHLIEGYYSDSLTTDLQQSLLGSNPRVVLIDCDFYASTVEVLRFLRPMLEPRSILLFDDWNFFDASPDRGERRALGEFLIANPKVRLEQVFDIGTHGIAFRVLEV